MTKPQVPFLENKLKAPKKLMQSEVPLNILLKTGEAASLTFTIPSQLDTYKKPSPGFFLGADCLHLNPPLQEKICSASPKGEEDSCTGLLSLHSPSSLPVFLHVREIDGKGMFSAPDNSSPLLTQEPLRGLPGKPKAVFLHCSITHISGPLTKS